MHCIERVYDISYFVLNSKKCNIKRSPKIAYTESGRIAYTGTFPAASDLVNSFLIVEKLFQRSWLNFLTIFFC